MSSFSITDHIHRLESTLLELLVDSFFPECIDDGDDNGAGSHNNTNDNINNNWDHGRHRELKRFLNIFSPEDTASAEAGNSVSSNITADAGDGDGSTHATTIHESIKGMSSKPIDLASGESCFDGYNTVSTSTTSPQSSQSLSCYIIDGKSTVYVADMDAYLIPDIKQQYLSTIQSLMDRGALDSSHPLFIVQVQFINDTNNNEQENAVNDDYFSSSSNNNNNNSSSNDNINSFIFFLLTGKLLVGLSTVAVFLACLLVRQYRTHRHHYDRDKSLQDTESSSGNGLYSLFGIKGGSSNDPSFRFNHWRPSSGDAFARAGDDDLVSCLSLQLEKSFENGAGATSTSNNNSSSPPPPKFLSLRRLLSFKREMKRDLSLNSKGLTIMPSIRQVHGDGSEKEEQRQGHHDNKKEELNENMAEMTMNQRMVYGMIQGCGLNPHSDIFNPGSGEGLNQEEHAGAHRCQKYFRQNTNRTLNSIKFRLSSWKFSDINTRYYWYLFMFIIISIVIALVKEGMGLVGTIGVGAQVMIVMTILIGVSIVVMILVYDQQAHVIDSFPAFPDPQHDDN